MKSRIFLAGFSLLVAVFLAVSVAVAQSSTAAAPADNSAKPANPPAGTGSDSAVPAPADAQGDPLKRPLTDKQKKANAKALKQELGSSYKKWLNEDVRWIITPEELSAFKQLSNDEERDQFIEQFWLRRDPTPDTVENEYKEEHYRRIAYANEHFAAGKAGWRTDRGRIYIVFGPPDEIDAHPSGGQYNRPVEEGGGETSTYPFETWRYRYIEGLGDKGQEVMIEFVDTCMCGDYHISIDPNEKDALLHTPGAGLTTSEQMGMSTQADRITGQCDSSGSMPTGAMNCTKQFDKLDLLAKLNTAPQVKFKDLEEKVNHKINVNLMPFDIETDFVKVTGDTVLVPITDSGQEQRHYVCEQGRHPARDRQYIRSRHQSHR